MYAKSMCRKDRRSNKKYCRERCFPCTAVHAARCWKRQQNCLYIDPALPLLLELAVPGEPCRLQEVQEGLGDTKAIIRVVRTPEDMAEKLRIFDCGLDDRVVETFAC